MADATKRCRDCGDALPATAEYFHRRRGGDGLASYCKPCARARATRHYYAQHEQGLAVRTSYRERHRETLRGYFRARRVEHHDEYIAAGRARWAANREALTRDKRAYARAHRAEITVRERAWAQAHPEQAAARETRKREQRRAARPDAAARAYIRILRADPCAYCGRRPTGIDHIVPIGLGGDSHWTNLAGVCKQCNERKHLLTPLEFLLRRQEWPAPE